MTGRSRPTSLGWLKTPPRFCQLTGYSRAELLGMTSVDLVHQEDRQREHVHLSAYLRGESPNYEDEKRYVRKDGAEIWVQVSAAMQRDPSGRPVRPAGIVQDITERKRAEEALRLSEERLRSLGDNLPNGAIYRYEHDEDGLLGLIHHRRLGAARGRVLRRRAPG